MSGRLGPSSYHWDGERFVASVESKLGPLLAEGVCSECFGDGRCANADESGECEGYVARFGEDTGPIYCNCVESPPTYQLDFGNAGVCWQCDGSGREG